MKAISQPAYKNLGYIWGAKGTNHHQRSWFQFADDAAIVSSDTKGSQALLNLFQAWCAWSNMTIRLDKCMTFGMLKSKAGYQQILPVLSIDGEQIPPVPIDSGFTYLGRYYDFHMNDNVPKEALQRKLESLLSTTSKLKVRPQVKLKILNRYISTQILFELKTYDFSFTWIENNMDAVCLRYVRTWLELPVNACLKEVRRCRRGRRRTRYSVRRISRKTSRRQPRGRTGDRRPGSRHPSADARPGS